MQTEIQKLKERIVTLEKELAKSGCRFCLKDLEECEGCENLCCLGCMCFCHGCLSQCCPSCFGKCTKCQEEMCSCCNANEAKDDMICGCCFLK